MNPLCRLGLHDGGLDRACVDCRTPHPPHPDRVDRYRLPHPPPEETTP